MSQPYQGVAYLEVFSPQGAKPLPFKVSNSKGVRREFDRTIKGTILTIEGITTQTKVQIPKDDKASLQLTHPYLVLQVFAIQGQPLYLELIVTDVDCSGKYRLIFSSSVKETVHAAHHTKLPLNGIIWNKWLNLCFHMPQLIFDNFKQLVVRTTDAIILGPCRIRKIFTLRDVQDGIPSNMDFPPGTDHQSLLFCTNPAKKDLSSTLTPSPTSTLPLSDLATLSDPLDQQSEDRSQLGSNGSMRSIPHPNSLPIDLLSVSCGTTSSSQRGNSRDGQRRTNSAGVRPSRSMIHCRNLSVDSVRHPTLPRDRDLSFPDLEGSLFSMPKVKLQFAKNDILEDILAHTPKRKVLPALQMQALEPVNLQCREQLEKYMAEQQSGKPQQWAGDREQKRVTFSASTKMEDGCSWSHLLSSPNTYDSLDVPSDENLTPRSDDDDDDAEEDRCPFSTTVHHAKASALLVQAAAAVAQALDRSPPCTLTKHPPHSLAALIRRRGLLPGSPESDPESPGTPSFPLCFSPEDHTPPVIHGMQPRSPVAPSTSSSSSSKGSTMSDRSNVALRDGLRLFGPSRYALPQPLDDSFRDAPRRLSTHSMTTAHGPVSPGSRPLIATVSRSTSLPSSPSSLRRRIDADLLPLCQTAASGSSY